MAGLSSTGFTIETFEEILASIQASLWGIFGTTLDLSAGSLLGQIIAVFAERIATLWELAEAINVSQDPDAASGAALEALAALTGTVRLPATASTATLTLTGTASTVVPTGSRGSTGVIEFATNGNATLVALTAWAASTAYTIGARRTNVGRSYIVTIAGTSAGSGGPTTTAAAIVDGTVTWRYMGEGAAAVDGASTATITGPLEAISGSINQIATPVSGWQSVINLTDATPGRNVETDALLRVRRELELSASGSSPPDAIRAALLKVKNVTNVIVFYNDTDVTDAEGVPPHSVEALVQGGADQDIWNALLANVAAGIGTHGTSVGTAVDTQGNSHTMRFTRPQEILIYVTITLTKDPVFYPQNGDDLVEAAIVTYGNGLPVGRNVVASGIGAQAFSVSGVLDVTSTFIGTAPSPGSSTTIVITTRQLALYDTSRITVTSSNGSP